MIDDIRLSLILEPKRADYIIMSEMGLNVLHIRNLNLWKVFLAKRGRSMSGVHARAWWQVHVCCPCPCLLSPCSCPCPCQFSCNLNMIRKEHEHEHAMQCNANIWKKIFYIRYWTPLILSSSNIETGLNIDIVSGLISEYKTFSPTEFFFFFGYKHPMLDVGYRRYNF